MSALPCAAPKSLWGCAMQRRKFLGSIPSVALSGAGMTTAATEDTPISRLFAEWERLHAHSCEPGISDEECSRRVDAEIAVEKELRRTPALTAQDFARKTLIYVGFGAFHPTSELWAEVCAIAGVPESRMLSM